MVEKEQDKKVENVEIKGEIELPKLDVKQYIGRDAVIGRVDVLENTQYGLYVEMETEPIDHIGKEGSKKPLTIKRKMWLTTNNETGDIGWTKESALGKLINRYGLNNFKDFQGKTVKVQTEMKNDREWLTF